MQLIETNSDGLKREFKVKLPAYILTSKTSARLSEICKTLRLPGFRPGKVPLKLVHKRYGSAVRAEIITASIQDSTTRILEERNLRPAMQPEIYILSEGNMDSGEDLTFVLKIEVLPELPIVDLKQLHLEQLIVNVNNKQIEKVLEQLANEHRQKVIENRPSRIGDILIVDIRGIIEGCEYPDVAKKNFSLKLGVEHFIPGFDAALTGARAGEVCRFTLVWPHGDMVDKAIAFVVHVKELQEVVAMPVDDTLAKSCGMESLDALRHVVWQQITQGYMARSRVRLKQSLFERLANYTFDVPSGMLEAEFSAIWQHVTAARGNGTLSPESLAKEEETLKAEYRLIAERRVRLGLLLAEIGRAHNITLTQTDVEHALEAAGGATPRVGHSLRGLDSLKVSVFEEKIVDFILATAPVTERIVTAEELFQDPAEGAARAQIIDSHEEVRSSNA